MSIFGVKTNPDAQLETRQEPSFGPPASAPHPELEIPAPGTLGLPKRKGGRKPLYATSEERKQRNRQAQAAFRGRRTEYIKQLETTIKLNEDALHALQQSQQSSADECAMLQYKNSMLEQILIENGARYTAKISKKGLIESVGIDVQAELQVSGTPPPPHPSSSGSTLANQEGEKYNRHHYVQSSNSMFAKLEPGQQLPLAMLETAMAHSPQLSPHASSLPLFMPQSFVPHEVAVQPPTNQLARQQHKMSRHHRRHSCQAPYKPPPLSPISDPALNGGISASSTYYNGSSICPTPSPHISQLEQVYDVSAALIDAQNLSDTFAQVEPFSTSFAQPTSPSSESSQISPEYQRFGDLDDGRGERGAGGSKAVLSGLAQYGGLLSQIYDPMLEVDPFGRLCASVDFSMQYNMQTAASIR